MSKGGDRVQAESDMDGRVMALEQTARGLNARLCAIERSYAPEQLPPHPKTCMLVDDSGKVMIDEADGDDFVPAAGTCTAYGPQWEIAGGSEVQHRPVNSTEGEKPAARRSLSVDIAGLAAGVILILISALLFTGNMEILKNPVLPFIFGVLLIACVCTRRHFG